MTDKEDRKGLNPVTKTIIPIVLAALISVLGTGAGVIAKHEGDIRTLNRKMERTNVDKYRRNLQHYRNHYDGVKECIIRNKRIARGLPEGHDLIALAENQVESCIEDRASWLELIENFVEENKHMGYD